MKNKEFVTELDEASLIKKLFNNPILAWIWVFPRIYLGIQWLLAGWSKVGNPVWTGDKAGVAVNGFLSGTLEKTVGDHPDVQGWYAWFIETIAQPNAKIFSFFVAYGEVLVGIALILGIFTGLAAFFGGFMNMNYLFAGTVSTNPTMLLISFMLVSAWKIAGLVGFDRWIIPGLGKLWQHGLKKDKQKR